MTRILPTGCRLLLAGVWLYAGATKVGDPAASTRTVKAYQLLPNPVAEAVGRRCHWSRSRSGCSCCWDATRLAAATSAALGIVALVALAAALFSSTGAPVAELGEGGIERWVAYPVVLWLVGFGGYLTALRAIDPPGKDLRPSTAPAGNREDGSNPVGGACSGGDEWGWRGVHQRYAGEPLALSRIADMERGRP